MVSLSKISDEDCEKIAFKIRSDFFEPVVSHRRTVFLCGANPKYSNSLRNKIANALTENYYSYLFDLIYPEEIFDELLYSAQNKDLLSLENLLAESVEAVVIAPESPGSFAELGAFVNSSSLRKRVICVIDKKYSRDRSFINKGPVKLIKQHHPNRVLYVDPEQIDRDMIKLRSVINSMTRPEKAIDNRLNLLQVDNFLLPAIYLLEPVTKAHLVNLVKFATKDSLNAYQITTAAVTALLKKHFIELTNPGFKLTTAGTDHYIQLTKIRKSRELQTRMSRLDDFRLDILNFRLRNKRITI